MVAHPNNDPAALATSRRVVFAAPVAALALALQGRRRAVAGEPADDDVADVLVRGESSAVGNGPVAWRVVQDVAEPARLAAFERRALGFAVNTSVFGALLVIDEATGTAFRLDPGEAVFTPDGVSQRRESLAASPVAYLRIALVAAASVGDAGGDHLRFAGPPFDLPPGPSMLSLVRVPLSPDVTYAIPAGRGDALVLVEQGDVDLDHAGGSESLTTTIGSDTTYAIRSVAGRVLLFGARPSTSILVATIA